MNMNEKMKVVDFGGNARGAEMVILEANVRSYLNEHPDEGYVVRTLSSVDAAIVCNWFEPRHRPNYDFRRVRAGDKVNGVDNGVIFLRRDVA